jgi:hypothetical protein
VLFRSHILMHPNKIFMSLVSEITARSDCSHTHTCNIIYFLKVYYIEIQCVRKIQVWLKFGFFSPAIYFFVRFWLRFGYNFSIRHQCYVYVYVCIVLCPLVPQQICHCDDRWDRMLDLKIERINIRCKEELFFRINF